LIPDYLFSNAIVQEDGRPQTPEGLNGNEYLTGVWFVSRKGGQTPEGLYGDEEFNRFMVFGIWNLVFGA